MTLPSVLAHVLVHFIYDVQTDSSGEDTWQHNVLLGLLESLSILLLEWLPNADVLSVDHVDRN